jgi:ankyrin repeat protein
MLVTHVKCTMITAGLGNPNLRSRGVKPALDAGQLLECSEQRMGGCRPTTCSRTEDDAVRICNTNPFDLFFQEILTATAAFGNASMSSLTLIGDALQDVGVEIKVLYATKTRNVDLLEDLLDAGADPAAVDLMGKTALMYAADNDDFDSSDALLKAGASHSTIDSNGKTALMYAVQNACSFDAQEALLDAGASHATTDAKGKTALMYAASAGCEGGLRALLLAGANHAATDAEGKTALMHAAVAHQDETLSLLIKAGACHTAVDANGMTALAMIIHTGASSSADPDGKAWCVSILEDIEKNANAVDFEETERNLDQLAADLRMLQLRFFPNALQ